MELKRSFNQFCTSITNICSNVIKNRKHFLAESEGEESNIAKENYSHSNSLEISKKLNKRKRMLLGRVNSLQKSLGDCKKKLENEKQMTQSLQINITKLKSDVNEYVTTFQVEMDRMNSFFNGLAYQNFQYFEFFKNNINSKNDNSVYNVSVINQQNFNQLNVIYEHFQKFESIFVYMLLLIYNFKNNEDYETDVETFLSDPIIKNIIKNQLDPYIVNDDKMSIDSDNNWSSQTVVPSNQSSTKQKKRKISYSLMGSTEEIANLQKTYLLPFSLIQALAEMRTIVPYNNKSMAVSIEPSFKYVSKRSFITNLNWSAQRQITSREIFKDKETKQIVEKLLSYLDLNIE